jgi:hypothetical protein
MSTLLTNGMKELFFEDVKKYMDTKFVDESSIIVFFIVLNGMV